MRAKISLSGKDVNKVTAIKALRLLTGLGLKEAKDFIECVMDTQSKTITFVPNPNTVHTTEAIENLASGGFTYVEDLSADREGVLKELKKLTKMAVEKDQSDIAMDLLNLLTKHSP